MAEIDFERRLERLFSQAPELPDAQAFAQRIEGRLTVPFPALPLGRYGNTGRSATLAPFAHSAFIGRLDPVPAAGTRPQGWYPSLGVGLLTVFDLLRFDVARGLRDGRWSFSVDVIRDFWSIL